MNDATPPSRPVEALLADRAWVRVMSRRLVRDPGRAEDVEQQAWLAALEAPPRDDRSPRGWLATVLRRAAGRGRRDDWRRDRRERLAARPETAPSTLDVVAQAEWHERVVRAVLDLPEPYRTTILLRYFEDLPPREVARRMGAPVETVRSRAQRALALLRERFDAQPGGRGSWAPALVGLGAGAPRGGAGDDSVWDPPAAQVAPPASATPGTAWAVRGALAAAGVLTLGLVGLLGARAFPAGASGSEDGGPTAALLPEGGPASEVAAALAVPPERPRSEPVPLALGPVRVAGRVVRADDGRPVAGARILAIPLDPMARDVEWADAVTDPSGRYAIRAADLPAWAREQDVMVVAMAQGLSTEGLDAADPSGWNPFVAGPEADPTQGPDLRLVPATRLHGRVVGPDGRPVAGATVEAWWRMGTRAAGLPLARPVGRTTTDGDGRFALEGWALGQRADVVALRPGSFPSRLADMAAGADESGAYEVWEEHRIPASRRIRIEVVGTDGRPVPGARVRAVEADPLLSREQRPFQGEWTAGEDGRIATGPVPDVPLDLRVVHPTVRGHGTRAQPGVASLRIEVALEADRGGASDPVASPGAFAEVLGPDGRPALGVRFLRWSSEGGFDAWGHGTGPWARLEPGPGESVGFVEILGARAATDGAALGATFRAIAPAPDDRVRLEAEVVVAGTVEAPAGAAVRGALVRARPLRWDRAPMREDLCVASARVDARGRFRLRGLGPEPYRLTVAAPPGLALSGGSVLAPSGGGAVTLRLVPAR